MTKAKQQEIHWLPDAEEHDYPAAASYLSCSTTITRPHWRQ